MGKHAVICALTILCTVGGAHAFQVLSVTATVAPKQYTGPCPVQVIFTGTITVDGPGTVVYRWEHSPGTGAVQQVAFTQAGTKTVTKTWSKDHNDYLALVTDSPNTKYALADFHIQCKDMPDLKLDSRQSSNLSIGAKGAAVPSLRIDVVNIGKGAYAPPRVARVAARNRQGNLLGAVNLSSGIQPGGRAPVTIALPKLTAGDNAINVMVDDENVVKEVREDNNSVTIRR